ncbi:MAG TPA: GerMN domain-containing protein [Verrucomicrobiae bacterium]|nr:GerMN domain-containing protein [Verrucomicrobiae bacterium]
MKSSQLVVLILVLIVAALGSWWFLRQRNGSPIGSLISVYYAKMDGTTQVAWPVSMRPQQPGESAAEHLGNVALIAAVQTVAGPPPDVQAVRFPPGTHVLSVSVDGTTADVDLSKEVENPLSGTFGESAEFESLVFTLTALPGIDAVRVTVAGRKLQTLPGGHLELDRSLHRSDW